VRLINECSKRASDPQEVRRNLPKKTASASRLLIAKQNRTSGQIHTLREHTFAHRLKHSCSRILLGLRLLECPAATGFASSNIFVSIRARTLASWGIGTFFGILFL